MSKLRQRVGNCAVIACARAAVMHRNFLFIAASVYNCWRARLKQTFSVGIVIVSPECVRDSGEFIIDHAPTWLSGGHQPGWVYSGANGECDWIVDDPDINFAELFAKFDIITMGRKTSRHTRQDRIGRLPLRRKTGKVRSRSPCCRRLIFRLDRAGIQ